MWRTMRLTKYMSVLRAASGVGGTGPVAWCVLSLVTLGIDVSHRALRVDCSTGEEFSVSEPALLG